MLPALYPQKFLPGDKIRIIAPAKSILPSFTGERKNLAMHRLSELGLQVSFGKYIYELNEFESTTIEHRLEDIHDAFRDPQIKGILTVLGGTTSNQLLKYLNYELIKQNPKILCGLSDITSLANAIHTKTGLVTYSGPHFTLFGAEKQVDYTSSYFKECFFSDEPIKVLPALYYCNHRWDTEEITNEGFWIINPGHAQGKIIGGNLVTLNLLQGSEYMPDLTDTILFLEDNDKESIRAVENHLQALINQPTFPGVRGIVFGRFQSATGMTRELLTKIVSTKKELATLPIIANVDFGHTTPMITFPIGGECELDTEDLQLTITRH